jgi:hypothetical protein
VALLEKRRYLNNRSGDFPQVILIVPSHVPNRDNKQKIRYGQQNFHFWLEMIFHNGRSMLMG